MFATNVQDACGKRFTEQREGDVDWILKDPNAKAWDAVKQQLEVNFKRNLIGSSKNDYTFLLDTKYDYRLVYGTWNDDRDTNGGKGRVSQRIDRTDQ